MKHLAVNQTSKNASAKVSSKELRNTQNQKGQDTPQQTQTTLQPAVQGYSPYEESELKAKVQIVIRVRPSLENEAQEQFIHQIDAQTLRINRPGNNLHMKFNNILPSISDQEDVYALTHESVLSFLSGTSNTIFAYGQTGAGKTYTILGDHSENPSQLSDAQILHYLQGTDRGILPRSLFHILSELGKRNKDDYRLFISFFEVYNEKIYDLFNNREQKDGLEIRESKQGDVQIPDLITVEIQNAEQALEILMVGLRNRATGSTMANAKSSRSHSIFQILLQQKVSLGQKQQQQFQQSSSAQQEEIIVESTLRIVDLAGSEKFKIPHDISAEERELRIAELTCINGSLSSLGHCVSALIDKNRTHIPFRNSKLTRALSDSLSGAGKITFIVCVSPSTSSSSETFSTLQFANRAKRAVLDGRNLRYNDNNNRQSTDKKKTVDYEDFQELNKEYAKEKALRQELEKQLQKFSWVEELEEENIRLKKENQQLRGIIQNLQEGTNKGQESGLVSSINGYYQAQDKINQLLKESNRNDSGDGYVNNLENLPIFQEANKQNSQWQGQQQQQQKQYFDRQSQQLQQVQDKQQQQQIAQYLPMQQYPIDFSSLNSNQSEVSGAKVGQFWRAGEEGEDIPPTSLINFNKLDQNKLLQFAKHREIKQKLEQFLAYCSVEPNQQKQPQQQQQQQQQQFEQNDPKNVGFLPSLANNSTTEEEFVQRMIGMVSEIQKKQDITAGGSISNVNNEDIQMKISRDNLRFVEKKQELKEEQSQKKIQQRQHSEQQLSREQEEQSMNNNEGQIMDQGKTSRDSKNSMIAMGNNSNENNSNSRNKFRKDISPGKNNCNKENNNYHKQDQQQQQQMQTQTLLTTEKKQTNYQQQQQQQQSQQLASQQHEFSRSDSVDDQNLNQLEQSYNLNFDTNQEHNTNNRNFEADQEIKMSDECNHHSSSKTDHNFNRSSILSEQTNQQKLILDSNRNKDTAMSGSKNNSNIPNSKSISASNQNVSKQLGQQNPHINNNYQIGESSQKQQLQIPTRAQQEKQCTEIKQLKYY